MRVLRAGAGWGGWLAKYGVSPFSVYVPEVPAFDGARVAARVLPAGAADGPTAVALLVHNCGGDS